MLATASLRPPPFPHQAFLSPSLRPPYKGVDAEYGATTSYLAVLNSPKGAECRRGNSLRLSVVYAASVCTRAIELQRV